MKKLQFIIVIIVLSLGIILQKPGWSQSVRGWTLTLFKPALLTVDAFADGVSKTVGELGRFWQAFFKNSEMEKKLLELESELSGIREIKRENERYKSLLEFRKSYSQRTIAAHVVARDPVPWRKMIVLDKGTVQGVQKDMAVVWYQNLIGRIFEVGPAVSRVILLVDSDSRVSALTSENRAQGIVKGTGTSKLQMVYLELDSGVSLGEEVLTSGMGGLFPKGLRIGTIVALERDSTGLHLNAEIEPGAEFRKVEEVLCIASSPEN